MSLEGLALNLGNPRALRDRHECVWTLVEKWTGQRGTAEVETNNRGRYRVTFGETVKTFRGDLRRPTFRSEAAREAAHSYAKIVSGFTAAYFAEKYKTSVKL